MGAAQSPNSIPIESVPTSDPNFVPSPTSSGVRVTGQVIEDVESRIQNAYLKGKQEGASSFQSSLEIVAAQVYDNVHDQLAKMQEEKLEQSIKKAAELQSKIKFPTNATKLCSEEEAALLACLKSNSTVSCIACEVLANKYSTCATSN
jgi:hypothetical protein